MKRILMSCAALAVLGVASASAASLRVTTADAQGAPIAGTLLIVQSLETPAELFRALTDKAGEMPARDVEAGRYRVIATYPHGPWKTAVRELVVEKSPVAVGLTLSPLPLQTKDGAPAKKTAVLKKPRLSVLTVDAKARPVAGVAILVRDPDATAEAWYRTNAKGEVVIDLESFSGAIALVSFQGSVVTERDVAANEIATLIRKRGRVILRVV